MSGGDRRATFEATGTVWLRLALLALLPFAHAPTADAADEPIADNSFLVEEAYNQGPGVVQHISTFLHSTRGEGWSFSFTEEWPAPSQRHQISYTLVTAEAGGRRGLGDFALNYRLQAVGIEGGPVAFAPRLSVLVPTGDESAELGSGGLGVQLNLPLSVELGGRWVGHWNAGATRLFGARTESGRDADLSSFNLAQGLVWLARPRLNFLLEATFTRARTVGADGARDWDDVVLVSPGVRGGFDFPSGLQIVPGLAFPIRVGPGRGERSVFFYLSFEHPFGQARPALQ
jgi:hypothetical protein